MCKNTVRWLYRVDQDFSWRSPFPQTKGWEFRDRAGNTWLRLTRDGGITVMRAYAWDGCTPKVCILDILLGTPDGAVDSSTGRPKTYYASLVHDALCQFLAVRSAIVATINLLAPVRRDNQGFVFAGPKLKWLTP